VKMSQDKMINFHRDVPYTMEVNGTARGQSFTIRGEGFGNASTGKLAGTYTCTSGVLPLSWAAFASTFQYGYKVFAKTNDALNYYQRCVMEAGGYTMTRKLRFHNDGVITSSHTVTMKNGTVNNVVELSADDFREDSPVLNGLSELCPAEQRIVPHENGVQCQTNQLYRTHCGKPVNALLESFDAPLNNAAIPRESLVLSSINVTQKVSGNKCYQEETHINQNNCWLEEMGDTPYKMEIDGDFQGKKFTIVGHGTGNPKNGRQAAAYQCTTGELPMAWAALSSTFQYGYKCFRKMPCGVKNYYIECLKSGGYTMTRSLEFINDGKITSKHTVTMDGAVVLNKVELTAEGFRADSPVLGDLEQLLESKQSLLADADGLGIRCLSNQIYLTKSGTPVLASLWSHDQHIGGVRMASEGVPDVMYSTIKVKQTVTGNTCHQTEEQVGSLE